VAGHGETIDQANELEFAPTAGTGDKVAGESPARDDMVASQRTKMVKGQ